MTGQKDLLNLVATKAQECFRQVPVIVLGSGASAAHKISGMPALSEFLRKQVKPADGDESKAWDAVSAALEKDVGLEQALQDTACPAALVRQIVCRTREILAADDIALLSRVVEGSEKLHLADTLGGLARSTSRMISVVTTNYDRIAEYSCDLAFLAHWTGFAPGIIRQRDPSDDVKVFKGSQRDQLVRIYKVHGSLDWFSSPEGTPIGLPASYSPPPGFDPLIVTPGVSKYQRTYDEPFRSSIQGADKALAQALSFLCIGYGFRDEHVQPRLIERCAQQNVPVVVLARTLTAEARRFIEKSAGLKYLALERHDLGTTAYLAGYETGVLIEGSDFWSLEGFNKLVM